MQTRTAVQTRRGVALAAAAAALTGLGVSLGASLGASPAHAQPQVSGEQCLGGGGIPVTVEFKGACVGGTFDGQPIDNPTDAGV